MNDVTVIIRTTGERTTHICKQICESLFGADNVFLVSNCSPFSLAVKKTFEIGLARGKKWTLAVDADVLVSNSVIRYIEEANRILDKVDNKAFAFDALLYDSLFLRERVGGGHLYQTKHLKQALWFINKSEQLLRPESYVKEKMQEFGHSFYIIRMNIGIHDFEQYYIDVFRKGIMHAQKNKIDTIYDKWKELAKNDKQYYWLCEGIDLGLELKAKDQQVIADVNFFKKYQVKYEEEIQDQPKLTSDRVNELINEYCCEPIENISIGKPLSRINLIKRDIKKMFGLSKEKITEYM